jgi:ribosomal protein S18 acetylase RimI-like enzyme
LSSTPETRSNESSSSVTLCAASDADQDFLLSVFASTRSDELAALAFDPNLAQTFARMQFSMQQQNYRARYPEAENKIILKDGVPVGRMLVDRNDDGITLVDIALLPDYRGSGIGSALIQTLLDEATAAQKAVQLSVYKINPAVRLYERLGFSYVADDEVYFEMIRRPAMPPA